MDTSTREKLDVLIPQIKKEEEEREIEKGWHQQPEIQPFQEEREERPKNKEEEGKWEYKF